MFKAKLLKSILIPTLGISAIGTIAAISTSCGCGNATHVTEVRLNKSSTTLDVDGTEQLTATVLPEDATDKSTTWTSIDTNVATVDTEGNVTAKADGTTTITATSVINPNAKATCKVTVNDACTVITANKDSTLELKNEGGNIPDLQYSIDGTNWSKYNAPINITQGDRLYIKGNNPDGWSKGFSQYSTLSITGDVSISGNVMGLLDNGAKPGEQGDITGIPCNYCFSELFLDSTGITSISDDFLPATLVPYYCYHKMFQGCTLLTTAPNLPAITLAYNCYRCMFQDCTSLTTTPKLPAATLVEGCYANMFQGCTSLTTAPDLPATKLQMNCYCNMFAQCTSLTTAPDLPATSLQQFCYYRMFNGCTSLNSIKIGYTGNYISKYFNGWVEGVADSGTFYYNGIQTVQDFQLPSGWTKTSF